MGKTLLKAISNTITFTCAACRKGSRICSICFGYQSSRQDSFLVCSVPGCAVAFHRQCYMNLELTNKDVSESSFTCPRHICLHCKGENSDVPIGICIRCSSMIHVSCRKSVMRNMRPLFFGLRDETCACLCNKCCLLILNTQTRPPKKDELELYLHMYVGRRKDIVPQVLAALFDTLFVERLCHTYRRVLTKGPPPLKVESSEGSNSTADKLTALKSNSQSPKEPKLKQITSNSSTTAIQDQQDSKSVIQSMPPTHTMPKIEEASLPVSVTVTTANTRVLFTNDIQPEIVCCQIYLIKRRP